jgi:HD-GYP domain-containing protein (c-di-GMP phosphodiesterase class II)
MRPMTAIELASLDETLPVGLWVPASERGRLVRALATLIRQLDAWERDATVHAREVAALSVELASRLGLAVDEVRQIRLGALLHDVGKLAVPDEILAKPGPLDVGEWELMRRHPRAGERVLEPMLECSEAVTDACVETVLAIVRFHHERWDGDGYPDRLAGESIPLGARIVAVADAFQAMTERRPYRAPRSRAEALAELERGAGRQFDPKLVQLLAAA